MSYEAACRTLRHALLAAALAASLPLASQAIVDGQLDDFQSGTTEDWQMALSGAIPPIPPAVVDAGPAGPGDLALRVTSTGAAIGAGGKPVINNVAARWTGNYTAAGIEEIMFDVNNLNAFPLTLRIGFDQPPLATGGGQWVTDGQVVPATSGWTTLTFSVLAQDLLVANTTSIDAATTLADVGVIRILHSTTADYRGDAVAGQMDLDNIEALPEPSLVTGLALCAGLLVSLGRSKSRAA